MARSRPPSRFTIFTSSIRTWQATVGLMDGVASAGRGLEQRLHPPLDRPDLLCLVIEPHEGVVQEAPAPAFRRVVAFDDRVAARLEMFARVPVGRFVAAADMAAAAA